jgi:hypothetical protein
VDAQCGANCTISCNADERVLNVMAMAANDGTAYHLSTDRTVIYDGPSKGMIKVTVVCLKR